MNWILILIPFISAFIGWLIFSIAIKMLFHPLNPKKILGVTFHGIFPKKQQQLASKLGRLAGSGLFSFNDLEQKVSDPANVTKVLPILETHIDIFLREKLTTEIPMLGMLIGDKTILQVKKVFIKELEALFPILMQQYMATLKNELDFEKIITKKVTDLSSDKLEEILQKVMSVELRSVTSIGAVLGFVIGILQVLLTIATR